MELPTGKGEQRLPGQLVYAYILSGIKLIKLFFELNLVKISIEFYFAAIKPSRDFTTSTFTTTIFPFCTSQSLF